MPTASLELLITLVSSVINLLLAILIYLNNPRSSTNRFFSALALTIAGYLSANYASLHQLDESTTFFWIKTVMAIAALINLFFFLLASSYPGESLQVKKPLLLSAVFSTLVLTGLAYTNLIFSKVELIAGKVSTTPGPLIPLFLLHTIILLGGGLFLLLRKYKKATGTERSQIRILLFGAILMFSLIVITNLILVLVFNLSLFVGFLPVYILIFTSFVSYAIVKHSLFNLRVIATQAFTVVIGIILLSKIFVSGSIGEASIDILVFFSVLIFGILLVRSVMNEVEQREKLQELTEKLTALDKQKDEFLSMAAHELRAPMTAIKGYVSMVIEGDTGEIPEKARGFLTDTNNITDRLIRLVNNMLNVSRIEEGRMTYQEEIEYLSEPVRAVFNQFTPEAERKGLKYTLEIPKEIKDKVKVDPDRIQEVLGNFLSNAIKYTDTGFVKLKMSQPEKDMVRVEVLDSGPGISKEEQKKLFQKFQRVESNVGKTTGTGLGLYISKLLVERFKGKIGIDSDLGKGSNFWFELPLFS